MENQVDHESFDYGNPRKFVGRFYCAAAQPILQMTAGKRRSARAGD
jgi:hypothetical protein